MALPYDQLDLVELTNLKNEMNENVQPMKKYKCD